MAVQADLVPDRGHLDAQVRVIGQQRHTALGHVTADHPVVAADASAIAEA